jgi:serine/threonine protein phosphatase PrpC
MRVNGIVAVSRAFGNFRHKVIIPEPDFKEFTLTGQEQYIVLACDGLWDVMNNESLRKFINKYMAKNGRKTQGISEALVNEALRLGSTDNVSVIFIEFNWWKEPKRVY